MLHDTKPFKGLMLTEKRVADKATKIVGEAIPDDVEPWVDGRPLRHFILTLTRSTRSRREDKSLPSRALVFFKVERTRKPWPLATRPDDVRDYLQEHYHPATAEAARRRKKENRIRRPASSINFDINEQSWLLIELDETINWRFSTTHPAATTKYVVPKGSNATLRYVVERVVEEPGKPTRTEFVVTSKAPKEHCRFAFFRVVRREENETQGFNFAIELYQEVEDGKYLYEIPIIVDPDVPDLGSEKFPPD